MFPQLSGEPLDVVPQMGKSDLILAMGEGELAGRDVLDFESWELKKRDQSNPPFHLTIQLKFSSKTVQFGGKVAKILSFEGK